MPRAAHAPFLALPVVLSAAGPLLAGGVDRGREPIGFIYEPGTRAELAFGFTDPTVSGEATGLSPFAPAGLESGDQADDFTTGSASIKTDLGNGVSLGFLINEPFGADVAYPNRPGYFAANSTADLDSVAATAVGLYRLDNGVSLLGALRYQVLSASAFVPFVTDVPGGVPYNVVGEEDGAWGYSLGVAYERPDIALRVSLTYNSAIDHSLDAVESSFLGTAPTDVEITTPQSVDLAFQTGVAPGTLLFGGVRWTDYTEFAIQPAQYAAITDGGFLVQFNGDVYTYTLGVGRQVTEALAVSASVIHEPDVGGLTGNLAPRDGETALVLGASYDFGQAEISGGIRYTGIGSATSAAPAGVPVTDFEDNDAISVGFGIAYTF